MTNAHLIFRDLEPSRQVAGEEFLHALANFYFEINDKKEENEMPSENLPFNRIKLTLEQ